MRPVFQRITSPSWIGADSFERHIFSIFKRHRQVAWFWTSGVNPSATSRPRSAPSERPGASMAEPNLLPAVTLSDRDACRWMPTCQDWTHRGVHRCQARRNSAGGRRSCNRHGRERELREWPPSPPRPRRDMFDGALGQGDPSLCASSATSEPASLAARASRPSTRQGLHIPCSALSDAEGAIDRRIRAWC